MITTGKALLLLAFSVLGVAHAAQARGGRGARRRQAPEESYYDILGVSKDADEAAIRRAYKKLALKWHPDRNPTNKQEAEDMFRKIANAYEVLSDAEKRKIYDQYGEEGLKAGGGPGGGPGGPGGFPGGHMHMDPRVMFEQFFGGGGMGMGMGGSNMEFTMGGGGMGKGMGGGFPGMGEGMGGMGAGRGGRGRGRSAPPEEPGGLYDGDSAVTRLDAASMPSPTSHAGWVWMVEFYAPWCGHCRNLAPEWKRFAASVKGKVKVGAVNCDDHKSLCSAQGVRGYPTIKALLPPASGSGPAVWEEYQGERSAKAMEAWALNKLPNLVQVAGNRAALTKLLGACSRSTSGSRSGGPAHASWDACMILVTDKPEVPALLKSLSGVYRGKVVFGLVRRKSSDVVAALLPKGPEAGSTLVTVCNGDLSLTDVYAGQLKPDPLHRYIMDFSGGKKCTKMVKLDASTDLSKLTSAQLKALVKEQGLDCRGCMEREDFVQRLQRHLRSAS